MNEQEYISKTKVMSILENMHQLYDGEEYDIDEVCKIGVEDVKMLPSMLKDQKKAKWLECKDPNDKRYGYFKCVQCGEYNGEQTPYCPYCGSKNSDDIVF